MLCQYCRVHLHRDHPYCLHCGKLRPGAKLTAYQAPQLRRHDTPGDPVRLTKVSTMVGRDPGSDLVLDDPSVSRHHARVVRGRGGFYVEDLRSFNGVTMGGRTLRGGKAMLRDGTILHLGDVSLIFEQPRGAQVGSRTMVRRVHKTMVGDPGDAGADEPAPTATEPLSVCPRQRSGWALKQLPDDGRGERPWVLRNTRTGKYLQLDDKDAFIWNQVDGENTIRDILFAYAEKYDELALPRIEQTLWAFASIELVQGLYGQRAKQRPPLLRRIGQAIFRTLLRMEVSIKGLDPILGRLYRSIGWIFFTRLGVAVLWALILGGLYGLWQASAEHKLFDLGGAGVWGAVAIGLGYITALALHELAHALAVKSYGRKVTRGGFMLMLGMPFAFVDTSDMWFGTRRSRLVVTLSGPLSTAALAGGLALYATYGGQPAVAAVCYQLAIGLYINTLYNLNPLLPLDGYQALADALRMPRLREESTAYFTKGIWRDLRARRRPGLRQVGLALYGVVAVVTLAGFAVIGLMAWRARLGDLVEDRVPASLQIIVVALGIGIIFFPIWYLAYKKIRTIAGRARAARGAEAIT
jgi:putative peptide zinc metalloprotease protein